MKVREFVDRYVGYVNYAQDRRMIGNYEDTELIAYAAAGTSASVTLWQGGSYTTVMIFETARLIVAYINGYRAELPKALAMIEQMEMVTNAPEPAMNELRKRALMEAI